MSDTDNQSFCPAPWNAVYLEPNGRIDSCCVAKNELGNVMNSDIEKIVQGQRNIQIKQQMLSGKSVPGCGVCHNKKQSLQRELVKRFPVTQNADLFSAATNFDLQYVDARWSNTCNLACVYCGPTLSSTWAQELGQENRILRQHKTQSIEYIVKHIQSLKYIYLAGGEPLLMKENEELVAAVMQHNFHCRVLVNTNLSNINNRLFKDLTSLPNCEWLVSVDAMESQYEYIRYPAKWQIFEQNLRALKEQVDSKHIKFNMVWMNINAMSLWDTSDWLEQQGFQRQFINLALYNNATVQGPFDVRLMPREFQQQVLTRMDKINYKIMPGWQNCFDYASKLVYNKSNLPITHLATLDRRRRLNSRQVFADFYRNF